jgi:hypothetical protein
MIRKLLFISFVVLILPLTHAFAQADQPSTTVVDLSDGYVISVPDGWEAAQDPQTGGFTLSNDEISLFVLNPEQVNNIVDAENAPLDSLLVDLYDALYDERPSVDDVEATEIDEREAASWSYEESDLHGIFYLIRLSDDRPGAVNVFSEAVAIEDQIELVTSIIISFDVTQESLISVEDFEPCFISTDQENTVQLRVGPGTNRTVLSALDAGEEFQVTGRFTTDDGSVWYQLVKEDVLPNSAANEIWVAADEVEETGNCDAVVDVAAPPIIPIVTQPPADESGDVTAAEPVAPTRGRWTVTFSATTTAVCPSGTITVASSEVYNVTSFTLNITAIMEDGSAFLGDGGLFERQSNGYYVAPLDAITLLYLLPTSETTMTGFLTIDDTCDITTGVTLTR